MLEKAHQYRTRDGNVSILILTSRSADKRFRISYLLGFQPFQVLKRFRPVRAEEPRERAVGEQSSASLAGGTVIRLVARVDDSLDGSSASRTVLSVAAVDSYVRP